MTLHTDQRTTRGFVARHLVQSKHPVALPPSPIPELEIFELGSGDEPLLQQFFEASPDYFLAVQGVPAASTEAHEEIHDELPPGWQFTKKWLLGYKAPDGSLAAMANITSDMLAVGVWHIGLFMVATPRYGSGDAYLLISGIEQWAAGHEAEWLRLGVAQGNAHAERFWERLGYVQARTRDGVQMGAVTNTVRVMVKLLVDGVMDDYLDLVPRDRPEPPADGRH
jgi:GNAT superfamily N-acetyltransferase